MKITKMPSMDNTEYDFVCEKCGIEFTATGYECKISKTACIFQDYTESIETQGVEMPLRSDIVCVCPICGEYVNYYEDTKAVDK